VQVRLVRFGEIEIDGQRYEHDVVIRHGEIEKRHKKASKSLHDRYGHTPLSLLEPIPWDRARLIVGTGVDGALPVAPDVREEARRRGIELVTVPTGEACRLLAAADAATTNAVLHVTC
jgi:hypothetical protein